jgi:iron complex outermembrane receptor protein
MNIRASLLMGAAVLSCPALASAQDLPASAAAAAENTGDIVVLGFGEARQVQSVTALDIERLTPGTTPLKAVQKLPGVNFQSSDAFGAYEWSSRISIRGFNQNQLGFTLDGVPLGDMSYGNSNGLHVSRAIISENVGAVTVAQGAGALGEASTSNLGGTLRLVSLAPSDRAGIAASGTYGSDDTWRGYVRLETGDITGAGLAGYLSYGYLKTDKWKGFGRQRQHQVNAKLRQDLGEQGSITAFFNFSDRREQDYQDLSLDILNRLGYDNDNISNDFALATRLAQVYANQTARAGSAAAPLPFPAAGLTFPAPYQTVDDVYFDAAGLRRDSLAGVTVDAGLTDAVRLNVTGYYQDNHGQGLWYTPYVASPTGLPMAVRTTEYDIRRGGAIARLSHETQGNRFEVGGWYESNAFRNARRFYSLANQSAASLDPFEFKRDPFFTQFDVRFNTETTFYYVSDRLTLDRLTITGGWKGYQVTNRAKPIVAGGLASGEIRARDWFLPQIGAVVSLGQAEVFATFSQNMRAFASTAAGLSPFATTQPGFDAIRSSLRPEKSDTYEVGMRLRAGRLQASLAGYYVNFRDRLLAFTNGAGIVGSPVTLQNVGDVRNYGVEATATVRLLPALSLFGSYAYNNSEYRDDVLGANGAVLVATRGRTAVDSPRHMAKGEIVYDDQRFLLRIGADYMSRRFLTYLNDQSVPGRVVLDATIGYRLGGEGALGGFGIEGSATNLLDKRYIGTIGSNGFTAGGDNQTLLAAAPRQFFVTLRKDF